MYLVPYVNGGPQYISRLFNKFVIRAWMCFLEEVAILGNLNSIAIKSVSRPPTDSRK